MKYQHSSFGEMLKANQQHAESHNKTIKISILRNITLEAIEVPLTFFAHDNKENIKVTFGTFDNVFQDSLNDNIISKDTDIALFITPLQALAPKLINQFNQLAHDEKQDIIDSILALVQQTTNNIRKLNKSTQILWLSFELPAFPTLLMPPVNEENNQSQFIASLNNAVAEILNQAGNSFVIDADLILRRLGENNFYDWRYWHIAKALYSKETLSAIAQQVISAHNAVTGKTKKCLVLDCDNTLWGGIIGEDGLSGIKLGDSYPGSCYIEFQNAIIELLNQGVILALCSKNNEQDVLDVFAKHPEMKLELSDISAYQINWQDKATNILSLAEQLNINTDSMVFVDDSEFEINLIRSQLPQVSCLWLNKNNPVEFARQLKSLRCFDKTNITNEDKTRTVMYQQALQRKVAQQLDLNGYLASMALTMKIFIASESEVARIAQQTQKTNQFNLTTKRYTEEEISHFTQDQASEVIAIQVSDKFGEMGIVGTAILKYNENNVEIDSFLLSCRALGRNIETAFIYEIIKYCSHKKKAKLFSCYQKTAKNMQVESFYEQNQFITTSVEATHKTYLYELNKLPTRLFDHINIDTSNLYESN